MATPQYNFMVNLDDLAFILKQIKIAEASTNPQTGAIENLPTLVGSPLLPFGLRTVDGAWNNLVPGVFIPAEGRPASSGRTTRAAPAAATTRPLPATSSTIRARARSATSSPTRPRATRRRSTA